METVCRPLKKIENVAIIEKNSTEDSNNARMRTHTRTHARNFTTLMYFVSVYSIHFQGRGIT